MQASAARATTPQHSTASPTTQDHQRQKENDAKAHHHRRCRFGTALAVAGPASASVTIDSAGKGFVGKGNVQTALGMNNSALQKAVDKGSVHRRAADVPVAHPERLAAGTQAGTQAGVQSAPAGTQSATQVVSQDLTCKFTNGNGTKTFHRDGVRDGERTGAARAAGPAPARAAGTASATAPAAAPRAASRPAASPRPRRRRPQGQPVHRLHPQGLDGHPVLHGDRRSRLERPGVRRLGSATGVRRLRVRGAYQFRRLQLR